MGRLYLFVHGLAVIAERNNNYEIALPTVPGHVYRAGSWLSETTIASGAELELRNVATTGKASIYGTGFLIDVPASYPLTQQGRAATLVVPKPKEVLGLMQALRAGRLQGVTTDFQTLADVVVLVYDYADQNRISLDRHYWQPSASGGATSLHVIATSEIMEGKWHEDETQQALRVVFQNFPGIQYNQGPPKPLVTSWVDPHRPHFGSLNDPRVGPAANVRRRSAGGHIVEGNNEFAFALAELEHPASRLQRLNRLGRMYQEKRRIESLWHGPDPLDGGDMSSCGPVSGN